jgi:hypothetical protein
VQGFLSSFFYTDLLVSCKEPSYLYILDQPLFRAYFFLARWLELFSSHLLDMPVSHLTLTVSHLPTSTSFFLSCLQPLGYQFIGRHDDYIGFGQKQGEPADFWITEQKPGYVSS